MCWSHAFERAVDPQGKGRNLAFERAVDPQGKGQNLAFQSAVNHQMLRMKGKISAGCQLHF
jgi:hypothetical protein